MSGGSHLYLKPYKFCLSRHSYTGLGPLTTSIKYHQRSGMRCLNFIEVSDQTIETSVLLTKVEELFEDHVQPLIGKLRKWGCDASPTFKYWDIFLVAVQIMLSNVPAEREGDWLAHLMSS